MKVLHITHGYLPEDSGGIERYLQMLVAAQRAAGDDVVVLAGSIDPRPACELQEHDVDGVRVLRLHRDDWYHDHYAHSYHPEASRLVRTVLAAERPDVVHVHQWVRLTSDLVAAAHAAALPAVVTLHDVYTSCPRAFRIDRDENPCRRPLAVASCADCVPRFGHETPVEIATGIELFRDQYRAELELADRVLVAAQVTADLLHEVTGLPPDRCTVQVLPYQPRFAGIAPARSADRPFRFAYWGSLTPHKGPHVLLDAFRAALPRLPREPHRRQAAELHMFGPLPPEPLRARLLQRAADLPVHFHGAFTSDDLVRADIDVAVFPVICFEGFGLALTEAFELGLPAIVSDIGALADRIGGAGLRVPPADSAALAAAMERLAADAVLRAACVAAIPALPPTAAQHAASLRRHYVDVTTTPRRTGTPLAAERRAQLFLLQRESHARALRDARGRQDPH